VGEKEGRKEHKKEEVELTLTELKSPVTSMPIKRPPENSMSTFKINKAYNIKRIYITRAKVRIRRGKWPHELKENGCEPLLSSECRYSSFEDYLHKKRYVNDNKNTPSPRTK